MTRLRLLHTMDRESQEFYQSGEEVEIGVYRSLSTGRLVRVRETGGTLPETAPGELDTYEWISSHPDWNEQDTLAEAEKSA
jgi:hypothetical protein